MRKWSLKILLLLVTVILASCSQTYPSISRGAPLALTINIKDMTISFIDLENREKITDWQMDKPYSGGFLLPDGDTLLLYGRHLATVDLYSLANGKKIKTWKTGKGIDSGILLENGKDIVFTDRERKAVRFFTTDGREISEVPLNENPDSLLERRRKNSLLVLSVSGEKLLEIDLKTKELINCFPVHKSASGVLLKEVQSGDEIWIGGHGSGAVGEKNIHVYDADTGNLLKKIPAPLMPVDFSSGNEEVFAVSHGSNTLYKISKDGIIQGAVQVGANPFRLAVFKEFIIVAGYDSNNIHFINQHSLQIEKSVLVGEGPFQITLRERQ